MKFNITRSLVAASLVMGLSTLVAGPAQAQGSNLTRAQVKMDRDAFLSMARWDEGYGGYVLKDDMPMPQGVASRAEVKAMRDQFLSMHTWNNAESQWLPVKGAPRDMSKLSREQVKSETVRFLKMYRYDEGNNNYVLKGK